MKIIVRPLVRAGRGLPVCQNSVFFALILPKKLSAFGTETRKRDIDVIKARAEPTAATYLPTYLANRLLAVASAYI